MLRPPNETNSRENDDPPSLTRKTTTVASINPTQTYNLVTPSIEKRMAPQSTGVLAPMNYESGKFGYPFKQYHDTISPTEAEHYVTGRSSATCFTA